MKRPALLGFHGLTIGCPEPRRAAAAWRKLLGLPVLRRTAADVVLGAGPELFVRFRRRSGRARIEEIHLAVEEIAPFRRAASKDPLGGTSFSRPAVGATIVVRQLERPPRPTWRKRRG